MKNPNVLRFVGLGFVVLLVALGIFFVSLVKKQEQVPLKQNISIEAEKVPSLTTKTYADDSGFTFIYPDDITVSKKESTDSAMYASLIATSSAVPGELTLQVADTKIASIDAWIDKNFQGASLVKKETAFGNMSGREVSLENATTVAAIYQGILFRLDSILQDKKDASYWQKVNQIILSDFSFVAPQAATATSSDAASSGGDDVVVEEDSVQ